MSFYINQSFPYYFSLSRKIDRMETAIIPLNVNLDKALEKLNSVSKEKKIRRKDMENIFDDIVKGEDGMHALIRIAFLFRSVVSS